MNNAYDTTQVLKKDSIALSPKDRVERIEESIERLVDRMDLFVEKLTAITLLDSRLATLEKLVYTVTGVSFTTFIAGVIAFFMKGAPS